MGGGSHAPHVEVVPFPFSPTASFRGSSPPAEEGRSPGHSLPPLPRRWPPALTLPYRLMICFCFISVQLCREDPRTPRDDGEATRTGDGVQNHGQRQRIHERQEKGRFPGGGKLAPSAHYSQTTYQIKKKKKKESLFIKRTVKRYGPADICDIVFAL